MAPPLAQITLSIQLDIDLIKFDLVSCGMSNHTTKKRFCIMPLK